MTSITQSSSIDSNKRRRVMIITGDEDILNQIEIIGKTSQIEPIVVELNSLNQVNSNRIMETVGPVKQKKMTTRTLTCVVCGGEATGYNFDAITCPSCKAFFRRNGHKNPKTMACESNEYCQVSFKALRRCAACRLTKCLNNGMRRDRLLTHEQRANKIRKIEENHQIAMNLHRPQSESSQCLLTNPASSVSLAPINQLLLTAEEQKQVENIQYYFQKRIDIAAESGLPWNPAMHPTSILQFINSGSVTALRLLSFFKQIPDFAGLHIDDKMTLIKYNLVPLSVLNGSLFYKSESDLFIETESDAPVKTEDIAKFHKIDLSFLIKNIVTPLSEIGQSDERIIPLSLVILLCTKGFSMIKTEAEPILIDEMAVFRVQSHYTELLWKYLETKNGRRRALTIFSKLMFSFMALQNMCPYIYTHMRGALSTTDIDHILPIMKSLLLL